MARQRVGLSHEVGWVGRWVVGGGMGGWMGRGRVHSSGHPEKVDVGCAHSSRHLEKPVLECAFYDGFLRMTSLPSRRESIFFGESEDVPSKMQGFVSRRTADGRRTDGRE